MQYSIGDVATELGISASTIRYYEAEKLIPRAVRQNGRRRYMKSDIESIRLVIVGRALGFGIAELKALRAASPVGGERTNLGRQAISKMLDKTNETIAQLAQQREVLERASTCNCTSYQTCRLTV